jgi:hypothetical protein
MSHARTIRIQKLQNKNRMVGKTFNPGGHKGMKPIGAKTYCKDVETYILRLSKILKTSFLNVGLIRGI